MPFADAIFPAWREETNYYKNVKPQNSNLNSGVWSTLERAIKIKASETTQTFDVYTGAFDSIEYLDNVNKEVEVHSKWYKMVINGIEGIVFIACNDNPSCSHELDKICTNMCKELNWLTPNARNKIICCSIKNFYNSGKIETIPGTEEVLEHFKMYPWLT